MSRALTLTERELEALLIRSASLGADIAIKSAPYEKRFSSAGSKEK